MRRFFHFIFSKGVCSASLENDEVKKTYNTTEKGLRLLELSNRINEIVDVKKTKKEEKNNIIV
ncbi:MAG TPA: hypothetical protein VEL70_04660 [Candidatus Acidoferrum sp.]|nr:hypothetical protein [Candidatus Acidoferrum sp.]